MKECLKCGNRHISIHCPECGWDNRQPTIGGYDPELDIDG